MYEIHFNDTADYELAIAILHHQGRPYSIKIGKKKYHNSIFFDTEANANMAYNTLGNFTFHQCAIGNSNGSAWTEPINVTSFFIKNE